jgi:hypothetical protein
MTPLSANSITGFKMASIGKEPNFAWTAKHQLSFLNSYCERRFGAFPGITFPLSKKHILCSRQGFSIV